MVNYNGRYQYTDDESETGGEVSMTTSLCCCGYVLVVVESVTRTSAYNTQPEATSSSPSCTGM